MTKISNTLHEGSNNHNNFFVIFVGIVLKLEKNWFYSCSSTQSVATDDRKKLQYLN